MLLTYVDPIPPLDKEPMIIEEEEGEVHLRPSEIPVRTETKPEVEQLGPTLSLNVAKVIPYFNYRAKLGAPNDIYGLEDIDCYTNRC